MSVTLEQWTKRPTKEKITLLMKNEKMFHVIFAEQFSRDILEFLCRLATTLRRIAKSNEGMHFLRGLLSHRSAMLYFTQPSTRTFLSFVRACQYLGINYAEVRDPRISSALKGESDLDGVRTFANYFDLIIMRHEEGGFAEKVAYLMNEIGRISRPIPVISGGAGTDEHPTQALLDLYTLKRSFEGRTKGIDGLSIAFVGDVARGRTVKSLSKLLSRYNDVKITFVSPEQLRIDAGTRNWLDRHRINFDEVDDLRAVVSKVDAVYMTRIQDEYDKPDKKIEVDYRPFHLTIEDVRNMKEDAIIMHPLPRRGELDPKIDDDHRAKYWSQERNGMWIRAALIAYLFNVEGLILDHYSTHYNY